MNRLARDNRLTRVNLTDEDARLMKGRQGIMPAYPSEEGPGGGLACCRTNGKRDANYGGRFRPVDPNAGKKEEMAGERVPLILADGGYHTAANLEAGERRGDLFVMPQRYHAGVRGPYFKDRFACDAATDSYICPPRPAPSISGSRQEQR